MEKLLSARISGSIAKKRGAAGRLVAQHPQLTRLLVSQALRHIADHEM
jgi:hypothetical protein